MPVLAGHLHSQLFFHNAFGGTDLRKYIPSRPPDESVLRACLARLGRILAGFLSCLRFLRANVNGGRPLPLHPGSP